MKFKKYGLTILITLLLVGVSLPFWLGWLAADPVQIPVNRMITRAQVVATGFGDALILAPDGSVWGWGNNTSGILGVSGMPSQSTMPRKLDVGSNWMTLAATFTAAYGIQTDGTLWGWTQNPSAGANGMPVLGFPPTQIMPGSNWVSLASGAGHCLALRSDGALFAWGLNGHGQVGDGSTTNVTSPVQVGTIHQWKAIAAGSFSSVGIQEDGSLWHWGYIEAGYNKGPDQRIGNPVQVGTSTSWSCVCAGDFVNAATDSEGSIWVWGLNSATLGVTNQLVPQRLDMGEDLQLAATGSFFVLFRKADKTAWIYRGNPVAGGSQINDFVKPYGDRDNWENVWAGTEISFGFAEDDTLWTWGRQLGVEKRQPMLDQVKALLARFGLGNRSSPGPQPKYNDIPWPIARFVISDSTKSSDAGRQHPTNALPIR